MKNYHALVEEILNHGALKPTRQGTPARTIAGAMFTHDMAEGYPLITTKKIPFRLIATELEFFIKGITDKKWLLDRNNHIWDEWASPEVATYGHDEASKKRMLEARELGPIYGFQWRHFGAKYHGYEANYNEEGVDQLKKLIETIKTNPNDRRMIVSAWNPLELHRMALPPCHYGFQVTVIEGKLNLLWNQRSVDVMLGLPFNIASYALLLHLLAKITGLKEGRLIGFLADTHIFADHFDGAKEQLARDPDKYPLPRLQTQEIADVDDWEADKTELIGYESYPKISFPIAI